MPQNGSILTQLKSMPPLPPHSVPLPCAVQNLVMIVIIPSAGYFSISQQQQQQRPGRWPCWRTACSTAALQHCKHWPRAACSAAAPAASTPRLYAARLGSCCSQRCRHTARVHAYCSTAARTQDTRICIGRDLPLYFCNLMFMETCPSSHFPCCFMLQSTRFLAC